MLLGILGAVSILPPYVDAPLGLQLDVASKVEVVDHVIPGAVVIIASAIALGLLRGGRSAQGAAVLAAVGASTLAGLWQASSHVPLLFDIGKPGTTLGAALLHSLPCLAVFLTSLALFVRLLSVPVGTEAGRG